MKLVNEEQTLLSTPAASRSWRAILGALVWIGGGIVALLALCTFGPLLVAYITAADLPLVFFTLLVSSVIAGWDVGGLMLIMLGVARLLRAYRSHNYDAG